MLRSRGRPPIDDWDRREGRRPRAHCPLPDGRGRRFENLFAEILRNDRGAKDSEALTQTPLQSWMREICTSGSMNGKGEMEPLDEPSSKGYPALTIPAPDRDLSRSLHGALRHHCIRYARAPPRNPLRRMRCRNGDLQALSFTVARPQLVDQRIESRDKKIGGIAKQERD
jgi:hypothetical protein